MTAEGHRVLDGFFSFDVPSEENCDTVIDPRLAI